jgi:hypothetical protein
MRRSYVVAAVVLPLLAIGLAIVRAELFFGGAHDFVFEIRGYDPRDLLRGRYLQFRLHIDELPPREPCDDEVGDCCFCLTRTGDDAPVRAARATCRTAREACEGALRTRYAEQSFRTYVPERDAPELERRLLDAIQESRAVVVLAVDRDGDAQVRELRVDGERIAGTAAGSGEVGPTTVP